MNLRIMALASAGVLWVAGCGKDRTDTPDPGGKPQAPVLDSVHKMTDGLHLNWTNVDHSCDFIEIERREGSASYAIIYTVSGHDSDKHDGPLDAGKTYSYRLRCQKASEFSDYSNELMANT